MLRRLEARRAAPGRRLVPLRRDLLEGLRRVEQAVAQHGVHRVRPGQVGRRGGALRRRHGQLGLDQRATEVVFGTAERIQNSDNPDAVKFEECLSSLVDISPRHCARHGHLSGRVLFLGGGGGRRPEGLGRVDGDRSLALLVRADDAGHGVASVHEIESDSLFESEQIY